ncbi:MAG: divergent PAP2 family protein [Hungatella sp.]
MKFWQDIGSNQVLVSSAIGWVVAQVLKTLIDFSLNRSFSAERLVGSGGMPSSHSSTVCALLVSSGICYGVSSFEFAVSFVLASVVMYDAIGVRQETGKQAKLLNMIMDQNILKMDNLEFQKRLKEFVGHTPLQVFAGAILGIGLALLTNLFYV